MIRMIFMGKSKESVIKALKHVIDLGVKVVTVVNNEKSSKLRNIAECLLIPVCSDLDLYEHLEGKKEIGVDIKNIDVIISFLFPKKIKKSLINLSRLGCINFHSAPLPEYRGWGVYNAAILNNEHHWGVSAHFVDENFDTGDIIKIDRFDINPREETAFSLDHRSQEYLFKLFENIVSMILCGGPLTGKPQKQGKVYSKQETLVNEIISPNDSVNIIDSKIRAFWHPPFAAKIILNGEKYFIVSQKIMDEVAKEYENK